MGLGVADLRSHLARVACCQFGHAGLVLVFAAAEYGHLQARVRFEQLRQCLQRHIGHLLMRQAAAQGEHGRLRILRQAEALLQYALGGVLAGEVRCRERLRQQGVLRRVPHLVVDAVEDGDKVLLARAQQVFHAAAGRLAQDFARIGVAYGGDAVGPQQARLQEAELSPELGLVRRIGRHADLRHHAHREIALEGQVVHGKHRPGPRARAFDEQRHEPGMPVVRLHDVEASRALHAGGHPRCCMAECSKAQGVVVVRLTVVVEIRIAQPPEQRRRIEQQHRNRMGTHVPDEQARRPPRQVGPFT
ncbi:hypothetical protein R76727_03309 [Ralstonia mannitolilytica]|nr:hypothetical protein R76727_03309 [Ralstonia mannitolilytica]